MSPKKVLSRSNSGCPKCQKSGLETEMENALKERNISYTYQKQFDWLKYKNKLSIDYFLPDYNVAIECQGEQHYESVKKFGGDKKFEINKLRDKFKKQLCEEHGIKLLYYTHYSNIQEGGDIYKDTDKLINEIT